MTPIPPIHDRRLSAPDRPTTRGLLASYLAAAAVVPLLWALSHPLAATVGVTLLVGSAAVARRAVRLGRCLRDCPALRYDLAGRVRITIALTPGPLRDV